MRVAARLAAGAVNAINLSLFPARLGSHCCPIAGAERSQGIVSARSTFFTKALRSEWLQLPGKGHAIACSFHTTVRSESVLSDQPPLTQLESGVPHKQTATGVQANDHPFASNDNPLMENADKNDVIIMDVAGSRPPKPELVAAYLSPEHFSAAEKYKWRKHELIKELQEFEHDTGTIPVQIGLLSERISYLTKHTLTHRKDHSGRRGLLILLSKRRKMLKHLRKKDFAAYVKVLRRFDLKDNYYQSGFGEKYRVGANLKWTPDQTDRQALPAPGVLRERLLEHIQRHRIKKFKVGSKVLTRKKKLAHERSKELIRNRMLKLQEGWEKRPSAKGESGFVVVENEAADTWAKRLQAAKKFMPDELSRPEFELQRLAAAAQRKELDDEGLNSFRKLRAEQRQTQRRKQREEKEALRNTVLKKYRNPFRSSGVDSFES